MPWQQRLRQCVKDVRHRPNLYEPLSTPGICVFAESTLARSILNTLDVPVDSVLSTSHVNVIKVLGRKKVGARLELLVERRGYETKPSRGLSQLQ
eukprot:1536725-Pyramimonas_sp.AAC.1